MKHIGKYGLYIPKEVYLDWKEKYPNDSMFKLIDKLICITEHGTICRINLKKRTEEANKEGKNKNYSDGLSLGKTHYIPKGIKKKIRKSRLDTLKRIIDEGKATLKETCAYKKLKLIMKG